MIDMVTPICIEAHDCSRIESLEKDDGMLTGYRVRRVGSYAIEIQNMLFNLRVAVVDVTQPLTFPWTSAPWFDLTGYGWCYSKDVPFFEILFHVWAWEFCAEDPARVDPPGPWIKAVHSGAYRLPKADDGVGSIRCPRCGWISHHPQDVANRYCGHCHQFHDAMEFA